MCSCNLEIWYKTTLCMAIAGFVPSVTGGDVSGEIEVNNRNSQESSDGMRKANRTSEDLEQ